MREITLTQGKVALVDDEDFELLNAVKWHAREDYNTFYAYRRRPRSEFARDLREFISMHSVVVERMGLVVTEETPHIDHKDGNGLNNCRENLRMLSASDNRKNTRDAPKGYTIDWSHPRKPYKVVVRSRYIGRYASPEEAHEAYLGHA